MKYIIQDYFYDPVREWHFENKDEVIQYLLEGKCGGVGLVVKE